MNKQTYKAPELELYLFDVEHGFAMSSIYRGDDIVETTGCGCRGDDCECLHRSECRGSGVNGCRPK